VQIDVENLVLRILMNFGFSLLQSAMIFVINKMLLGQHDTRLLWLHELIRAALNTVVAVPLFLFLDRFKLRD